MEEFNVIAKIKKVGDIESPKKDFRLVNFVATRQLGSFTQELAFQLLNDNVELAELLEPGKTFDITFDIKCRRNQSEDSDGYFTNLVAYRIDKVKK